MQQVTGYPVAAGGRKNFSFFRILFVFFYQALVFSIALPLALMVLLRRGCGLMLSLTAELSLKCCVWIFLATLMLLLLLVVLVQLTAASMG